MFRFFLLSLVGIVGGFPEHDPELGTSGGPEV